MAWVDAHVGTILRGLSETQKGRAHANGKSGDQRGKRPQRGRHATGKRKTG